jgi:hypothetical protein
MSNDRTTQVSRAFPGGMRGRHGGRGSLGIRRGSLAIRRGEQGTGNRQQRLRSARRCPIRAASCLTPASPDAGEEPPRQGATLPPPTPTPAPGCRPSGNHRSTPTSAHPAPRTGRRRCRLLPPRSTLHPRSQSFPPRPRCPSWSSRRDPRSPSFPSALPCRLRRRPRPFLRHRPLHHPTCPQRPSPRSPAHPPNLPRLPSRPARPDQHGC